jgi:hypothetical protein
VRTDRVTVCWGTATSPMFRAPRAVVSEVSSGASHACWVDRAGTAECWGSNVNNRSTPVAGTYRSISAGSNHTCALTTTGSATCWGANTSNQATPPAGTYGAISAGTAFTCAIKTVDRLVTCWGLNNLGQASPPVPPAGTQYTQVSAGTNHACALTAASAVVCWGSNAAGQAGQQIVTFKQVSAGDLATCGVRTSGVLACWGSGLSGTPPTGTFTKVSVGTGYACAIRTDASVACWGSGNVASPLTIRPTGQFVDISAGADTVCALRRDGVSQCFGERAIWGGPPGGGHGPHGFTDVAADAFYELAVRWLKETGVTTGFGGSTTIFNPGATVTRGQMALFLHRLQGLPVVGTPHGFNDVPTNGNALDLAVRWLKSAGVTTGLGGSPTTFGPGGVVTRGQMAAFLHRVAGQPSVATPHGFSDVPSDAFYAAGVRWLKVHLITTGFGGSATIFNPNGEITRGQMATFLWRLATTPKAWPGTLPPTMRSL